MPTGHPYTGEPCPHFPNRFRTEAAHIAKKQSQLRYDERKRQERPAKVFESDGYSLRLRLQHLLANIKFRCRSKPRYAGRGIQCLITYDHLLFVWIRDKADTLKRPSIDRINNDGHYELSNIRFIEQAENIRRGVEVREQSRTPPAAEGRKPCIRRCMPARRNNH